MAIDPAIPVKDRPSVKKPRTSTPASESPSACASSSPTASATAPEEDQNREESTPNGTGESMGLVSVTLADPAALDCPICFEPLCSPVFQCENGHIACGSCCTAILNNKCSICCLTIGSIRNRAVEQFVASVRVTCKHKSYGCTETLRYSNKVDHENKCCTYVPCSCPCCDFVGNSKCMYHHFALKHKDSATQFDFGSDIAISMSSTEKKVILQERKEGVLFVLNSCKETLGSFFNVVCVAPPASEKSFFYELSAQNNEERGFPSSIRRYVETVSKWTAQDPTNMTLIPSKLMDKGLFFLIERAT